MTNLQRCCRRCQSMKILLVRPIICIQPLGSPAPLPQVFLQLCSTRSSSHLWPLPEGVVCPQATPRRSLIGQFVTTLDPSSFSSGASSLQDFVTVQHSAGAINHWFQYQKKKEISSFIIAPVFFHNLPKITVRSHKWVKEIRQHSHCFYYMTRDKLKTVQFKTLQVIWGKES